MYGLVSLVASTLFTGAFSAGRFYIPRDAAKNLDTCDYGRNSIYTDGATIQVKWELGDVDFSDVDVTLVEYYPSEDPNRDHAAKNLKIKLPKSQATFESKIDAHYSAPNDDRLPDGESRVWQLQVYEHDKTSDPECETIVFNITGSVPGSNYHDTTTRIVTVGRSPTDTPSPTTTASSTATELPTRTTTGPNVSTTDRNTSMGGASNSHTDSQKTGGLSTGAAIGIGVDTTIGGLLILAGIGVCAWRRRQKRDVAGSSPSPHVSEKVEDFVVYSPSGTHELDGSNGTVSSEADRYRFSTGPQGVFEAP